MANGTEPDPHRSHTRYIVGAITILGLACAVGGTVLIFKGFAGDLLIGGALAAISGLCGFLGGGRMQGPQQQDITLSTPNAEMTQKAPTP